MIGIGSRYNGSKHNGFVRFVLEIPVPKLVELWTHLLELFWSRSDLRYSTVREIFH